MRTRRAIVAALSVCAFAAGCGYSTPSETRDDNDDLTRPAACKAVYGFTVSYAEQWLAYYGIGQAIHLQRLPNQEPAGSLSFHNLEVQCAVFHPWEDVLLACYVDGSIVRWTRDDECWTSQLLGRQKEELICCAVSPDGEQLVVGDNGGNVTVWSLDAKPRILKRLKHAHAIWSVRYSRDGNKLAVSGAMALLKVWDVPAWTATTVSTGHYGTICDSVLPDDSRLLITAGYDGTLRQIELCSGRELWSRRLGPFALRTIAVSPDGGVLAVGSLFSGNVQLRDTQSGRLLGELPVHNATITCVRFLSDGSLVTSSHDGNVELFENVLPSSSER